LTKKQQKQQSFGGNDSCRDSSGFGDGASCDSERCRSNNQPAATSVVEAAAVFAIVQ